MTNQRPRKHELRRLLRSVETAVEITVKSLRDDERRKQEPRASSTTQLRVLLSHLIPPQLHSRPPKLSYCGASKNNEIPRDSVVRARQQDFLEHQAKLLHYTSSIHLFTSDKTQ